jgi:hypothetical protein
MLDGDWYISFVSIYDKAGNKSKAVFFGETDYSFKVGGGNADVTPPTVDKITLGQTSLKVGDKIQITLDVSDVGTGIDYINLSNTLLLQHKQSTQGQFISPSVSSGNGKFQFEYVIPQNMLDGDWYISFVSIYDKAGNKSKAVFFGETDYSFKVGATLIPTFGVVKRTDSGFNVNVTNYEPTYVFGVLSTKGTASINNEGLITVTGLAPSENATVTVTTSRSGYTDGSATISGTALSGAGLTPMFGVVAKTANGFKVQLSNYDSSYIYSVSSTKGKVTISKTGLITVAGLAPGESTTVTIKTTRTGYTDGSANVSGAAQIGTALTPAFGTVTKSTSGFTVKITNYSDQFKWGVSTSSGKVSISKSGLITVSGLTKGKSATVTVSTTQTGYNSGAGKITSSTK